jgi:hypothetical protein
LAARVRDRAGFEFVIAGDNVVIERRYHSRRTISAAGRVSGANEKDKNRRSRITGSMNMQMGESWH